MAWASHVVCVGVDDGGAPLAQDDFGAHRHFDGLATSQRGDAPVGGADLRPVRGKQVLEPRAVGGGSQAQVRAREGQGRVGDVDSARAVVGSPVFRSAGFGGGAGARLGIAEGNGAR